MVRHGEIPSNVKKIYAGTSPEGLTEKGIFQAGEVSVKLKNFTVDAIYASPIHRAVQTAEIISEAIGIDFLVENAFRELELGPWEGLSEDNIEEKYPEKWRTWNTRPAELRLAGRETLQELQERVLKGIQDIYREASDKTVVVVTHVAIIRVLLLWHEEKSLNLYKTIHVPNAKIFEIYNRDM
jgi:alpha-ribazole phosphatase/probable phosphoglycerate mutase